MDMIRVALVGCGNVGRAFIALLERKQEVLRKQYGLTVKITGIATRSHGSVIQEQGVDGQQALQLLEQGLSLDSLPCGGSIQSTGDFIARCPADVLFENSPVNPFNGEPALSYLVQGLEQGMHVVTANKGAVVHGYARLMALAQEKERCFRFESVVMDGAPVFSLYRSALPALELMGFVGILNSTTNLLLEQMEAGQTLEQAIAYGKSVGITETDPSVDIDGWDASIKIAALVTGLMKIPLLPQDIDRQGIRSLTPAMLQDARQAGKRWKLVCRAARTTHGVTASVKPELVGPESPLFSVHGTSSIVVFQTDVLPGLGILELNPTPDTTAYGLLTDLLSIYRPA